MNAFIPTPADASSQSQPHPARTTVSRKQLWTGRVLSGLAGAFLLFDGGAKVFKAAPVVETMTRLGYSESTIVPIGVLLLVCTVFYLIPRTSTAGAVLLSAYLGGAVTTNLRIGGPVFPVVFPVLFGIIVWTGISLRDVRVREFLLKV
jgi:hypothetical protein